MQLAKKSTKLKMNQMTAYEVWANRDLLKYNTALSAHLNYVVFWNINDVMNFVLKKFN